MKFVLCLLLLGGLIGCAALQKKSLDEPGPKARSMLREGNYAEGKLIRRFTDGNLLVRLGDGQVVMLGPKETCSWCWMYVSRTVYVELGEQSAVLLSPNGEQIGCWNGGPVDVY